ncbi:MAG TPA: beta-N-acetylhexosaminidase [Cyclobacteriaceae bacterium]|nr:beta-N-acetylhexosaminidase [Cyclobacteriaceae bacterium]
MKTYILYIGLLLSGYLLQAQQVCNIIPMPVSYKQGQGTFTLNQYTVISASSPALKEVAFYLQQELFKSKSLAVSLKPANKISSIVLSLDPAKTVSPESYNLVVTSSVVQITAREPVGIFYGIYSLLQLIEAGSNATFSIPVCEIHDAPRYQWRGFMLDESRHFFGKEKVKSILDWMAFYKLNRFHWHLTDEPGWRIEIKQYPLLTLVGGIGEFKNPLVPAQYYTQEEIKEIVSYAQERFITVIPEIDMPGHAAAANRAYHQFSGGGTLPTYPDFTFNPGNEKAYEFLTNILREVDALFPSQMIHLGGDEVQYGNSAWETDEDVKKLRSQKNLKDLKAVEYYFIQRMADSISTLGNRVLAWDEIIDAPLPSAQPIIFWWRQDKPIQLQKAMDKGYETVLCPRLPLYFDFVQDSTHRIGRRWKGAYNSLSKLYSFSHEQFPEIGTRSNQILGIQANLWTETVDSPQRLDYLMFPRIAALAEAAWTASKQKDYSNFELRLKPHLKRYKELGIYYYNPFDPLENPEAVK